MRSNRARWLGGLGVLVLIGAMLVVEGEREIALADDDGKGKNPFSQILKKLDEILAKLNGGGGENGGNYTLRWDQNLPSAQRFMILAAFNNQAVLDKNTGLVWERSPDDGPQEWSHARRSCADKQVGGQKGWRLPSFPELSSLVDPNAPHTGPTLPPGHPFLSIQRNEAYWSATTNVELPTRVWGVTFVAAQVLDDLSKTGTPAYLWCVRSGMNANQY